jgi:mono/diheme cytochrome c family protein
MADEDLLSIIAFLRSDDPWTEPKDVDDLKWQPTFLAKMLMHVAFRPMQLPSSKIPLPDPARPVAFGKYVVHAIGDCFVCHSADFKTLNALQPEKSGGYFGGGNHMLDAGGLEVNTANLTMDPDTGIGKWTEEQFVQTVKTGIRFDGRVMRYPMVGYSPLSDVELKAAYAYLKTVPVIKNQIDRHYDRTPAASASEGEKLFNKYACTSCHGASGVGVCDLRQASKKYDSDEKLSAFIHDAGKFVPNTMMPTWGGVIAEAEYPSLIEHVHKLEHP